MEYLQVLSDSADSGPITTFPLISCNYNTRADCVNHQSQVGCCLDINSGELQRSLCSNPRVKSYINYNKNPNCLIKFCNLQKLIIRLVSLQLIKFVVSHDSSLIKEAETLYRFTETLCEPTIIPQALRHCPFTIMHVMLDYECSNCLDKKCNKLLQHDICDEEWFSVKTYILGNVQARINREKTSCEN